MPISTVATRFQRRLGRSITAMLMVSGLLAGGVAAAAPARAEECKGLVTLTTSSGNVLEGYKICGTPIRKTDYGGYHYVFVIGLSHQVYYTYYGRSPYTTTWHPWMNLGGWARSDKGADSLDLLQARDWDLGTNAIYLIVYVYGRDNYRYSNKRYLMHQWLGWEGPYTGIT